MEVEIGRGKKGRRAFGFDDIAIVPSRRTRDPDDIDITSMIGPYRLEALLGERGQEQSAPPEETHAPGAASTDASPDSPTDPTDQVSGDVPPLQDPVAPPVAPPPDGGQGPGQPG